MSELTRRGLMGAATSLLGLAACDPRIRSDAGFVARPDNRPAYDGAVRFEHGVASGDPLPDAVILWTRVTPENQAEARDIPVTYTVYADKALEKPVTQGQASAAPGRDYTVKVDVRGLEPGQDYYFQFEASTTGGSIASPSGRTRTTAQTGEAPVRLAVISCANWPFGLFNVYREVSRISALDAVIHLGDYIYEYGMDGYGGPTGQRIGRNHEPPLEAVTLGDYRIRHAQYKSDPSLQAAHAAAPWLCTWDDHESANDANRDGAENHNAEANEGNWSDRKQAAVQAYMEWMPVRDPVPGQLRESIYRRFDFGDVASICCLESRLTGRSEEISWFTELGGLAPERVPLAALSTMGRVQDETRSMLGQVQEDWLAKQMADSVKTGKAWQVLANQVIMARVRAPNLNATLSAEQIAAQDNFYVQKLIPFSLLGLPWNLDAWDGFPAARDRLYAAAKDAGARLVTLTGDTHTAWANRLLDKDGAQRGVEFGCSSVTSPGFGTHIKAVGDIGRQFAEANEEVEWHDANGNGWTELTLTTDRVEAVFRKVSTILESRYTVETAAKFSAEREKAGAMTGPLQEI